MSEIAAPTVMVDGTEYLVDTLSDEARSSLLSVQIVDKNIMDKQQELGILQTARAAYHSALVAALPQVRPL